MRSGEYTFAQFWRSKQPLVCAPVLSRTWKTPATFIEAQEERKEITSFPKGPMSTAVNLRVRGAAAFPKRKLTHHKSKRDKTNSEQVVNIGDPFRLEITGKHRSSRDFSRLAPGGLLCLYESYSWSLIFARLTKINPSKRSAARYAPRGRTKLCRPPVPRVPSWGRGGAGRWSEAEISETRFI